MSILGYSSSYFLPEYWANTPLYGEKLIPLIDYILSNDFSEADKLSIAFYNLANKYKNTPTLPIEQIEAIIEESGYGYVRDLLGRDEKSIRLLVSLLVLIHQWKGSETGLRMVLGLLRGDTKALVLKTAGKPHISKGNILSEITTSDYIYYTGFTTGDGVFELKFKIRTGNDVTTEQCIASGGNHCFYIGINNESKVVLKLGNDQSSWNIAEALTSTETLSPNTTYYLTLSYDGSEYNLSLSEDDKKYHPIITVAYVELLDANNEFIFIGVDKSGTEVVTPFLGTIDLGPFVVNVDGLTIEQWFQHTPVEAENTYAIITDLDITLISSDFFINFTEFAKRYVYPSLTRFEATFTLENNIALIPYARQSVRYIAAGSSDADTSLTPAEGTDIYYFLKNYRYPMNVKKLTILESENTLDAGVASTLERYTELEHIYFPNLNCIFNGKYKIPEELAESDIMLHFPINFQPYIDTTEPHPIFNFHLPANDLKVVLPASVTSISTESELESAFENNNYIISADLSSITSVSGSYGLRGTFYQCTGLRSVDLGKLTTISGTEAFSVAFSHCTSLTSVNFNMLTTIEDGSKVFRQAFYGCTALRSVDLSNLVAIGTVRAFDYTFSGCTALKSVNLRSLTTITGAQAFYYT